MEIRDRKAAQRRAGIMARRGLPQAERAAANAAICARLLAMPCFQKAENLLLYAAFGGEVDLAVLAEQAARLGKTVAYPVCGENFTLTAAVPGPDGWEVGAYGIRTPVLERAALHALPGSALLWEAVFPRFRRAARPPFRERRAAEPIVRETWWSIKFSAAARC